MRLRFYLLLVIFFLSQFTFAQNCDKISIVGEIETIDPSCNNPVGSIKAVALHQDNNPLQYKLLTGDGDELYNYQENGEFTSLTEGQYVIVVQDKKERDCTLEVRVSIRGEKTVRIESVSKTNTACDETIGTGSLTINAVDAQDIEYSIDGTNWQMSNEFTDLKEGTYTVYARAISIDDPNKTCQDSKSVQILKGFIEYDYEIVNETCAESEGSINVTASGKGAIQYKLEGDATTTWRNSGLFENLPTGVYRVLIRDTGDNNCEVKTGSLRVRPVLSFTTKVQDSNCNVDDGSIRVVVNNVTDFEYSIDNVNWQDSPIFNNLGAGSYTVYVRSKSNPNCTRKRKAVVDKIPDVKIQTDAIQPTSCSAPTGAIRVSSETPDIMFILTKDGIEIDRNQTGVFENLEEGAYQVTTPAATCGDADDILIRINNDILIKKINPTKTNCNDATAEVTFEGSSRVGSSLEYSIDNGATFQDDNFFTGLTRGQYDYVVRSIDTQCERRGTFTVVENTDLTPLLQDPQKPAFSCDTGSFTMQARAAVEYGYTGGQPVILSNVGLQTGAIYKFDNLQPGIYNFYAKDKNGCIYNFEEVDLTSPFTIFNITTTPSTCNDSVGTITVDAKGKNLKYRAYNADKSIDTGFQGEDVLKELASDTYTVEVKEDVNAGFDCIQKRTITVGSIGKATLLNPSITHTSCGNSDGEIFVQFKDDGGSYDFTVKTAGTTPSDSDYTTDRTFTNLAAGDYVVYMRDKGSTPNGDPYTCIDEFNVTINDSTIPSFELEVDRLVCTQEPAEIRIVNVEGGVGTIRFALNDSGNFQDVRTFSFDRPGTYKVTAIDESNKRCQVSFITEVELDCEALFPDIFVPNKNGKNDIFQILYADRENLPLEIKEFSIYNKYGNLVHQRTNFSSYDIENWWTGEGYDSDYYAVTCTFIITGKLKTYNGTVYLMR